MPLQDPSYRDEYQRSFSDPEGFWLQAAKSVHWVVPPQKAHSNAEAPISRWFPDGVLNTSYNALDRHVAAGRGEQPALIHDSAMLGKITTYSYR